MNDIDLKALETKAWSTTFEDGFIDIMLGVLLIVFAFMPIVRAHIGLWYIPIAVVFPAMFSFLLIFFGKRHITEPRIGLAKFGPARTASLKKSAKLSIVTFIVLAVLVILTALSMFDVVGVSLSGYKVPLAIALGTMILLAVKARLLGIPRLEIYGIVFGICILSVEVLRNYMSDPWHNVISWGIPGMVILIYGIRRLKIFMDKFPLPTEGEK